MPATCAEGYFVWLDATWSDAAGLTALAYGSGITVPTSPQGDPVTGTAPTRVYLPLVFFTSNAGIVDPPWRLVRSPVTLRPYTADQTCLARTRNLGWYPLEDSTLNS